MEQVSNRFFVSAITDGVTIHGSLRSDKSLVQAWNGGCVPDWLDSNNQPTITLSLLKGSTPTVPTSGTVKWYINNQEITQSDTRFVIGSYSADPLVSPTLKIVKNLASSANVDLDIITCTGTVESGGVQVEFSASIEVKISTMAGSGYVGVVSFPDGSDISSPGQEIRLVPTLFRESGSVTDFTVRWYFNGTEVTATSGTGNRKSGKNLIVTEAAVTDYVVVRCDYYVDNDLVTSEHVGVDDTQDVEFMYIQFNGANGNSASLHSGQSVTFDIWVAASDNPDDLNIISRFTKYEVQLLNSRGQSIQNFTDITQTYSSGTRNGKKHGVVAITYDQAQAAGGNITGIVRATGT